jgi:hypothetical protein
MNKKAKGRIYILKYIWLQIFWLIIGLVCFFSIPAQALWFGQSQVNPFLEVQEVYETNVFQTSEDAERDAETVISPGLHLEFPTAKDSSYRFLANYRANIKLYGNNGDATLDPDEELNTVEHRVDGQVQFNLASGFKLAAGDIFNLTSVPPDFPGDTREKYTQHDVFAQVAYAFVNRYELQVRYDGTFKRFKAASNAPDDLTAHRGEVTFFYRLFNSMSVLGGGGYATINRQEPSFSDSKEYRGFGGVRLEMTDRLTGTVKVGVLSKKFTSASFTDTTEAYVSGDVVADVAETTRVTLKAQRTIAETSLAADSTTNGAYYVVTGLQAVVTHTLAAVPNLSLSGSGSYQHETYPEDVNNRRDNRLEVGVGAEYKLLKYLVIGANYTYLSNDSTLDANDYTDNILMLKVRAIL